MSFSQDPYSLKARRKTFGKLRRCLGEVLEVHPRITAQAINVLLLVAVNPGKSSGELAQLADIPVSSMSRYLLELSIKTRRKEGEALGLVEGRIDVMDLRVRNYFLTQEGLSLLTRLSSILEE